MSTTGLSSVGFGHFLPRTDPIDTTARAVPAGMSIRPSYTGAASVPSDLLTLSVWSVGGSVDAQMGDWANGQPAMAAGTHDLFWPLQAFDQMHGRDHTGDDGLGQATSFTAHVPLGTAFVFGFDHLNGGYQSAALDHDDAIADVWSGGTFGSDHEAACARQYLGEQLLLCLLVLAHVEALLSGASGLQGLDEGGVTGFGSDRFDDGAAAGLHPGPQPGPQPAPPQPGPQPVPRPMPPPTPQPPPRPMPQPTPQPPPRPSPQPAPRHATGSADYFAPDGTSPGASSGAGCHAAPPTPEPEPTERMHDEAPPPETDVSMADFANAFGALKLRADATPAQINTEFKKLSLKAHPDKPGGSEQAMKKLTAARELALEYARLRAAGSIGAI